MRPEISIIVPVYNTENYLDKCIESILTQSFKNIELILVDDGSTDSSGDICDKYRLLDDRVVVIHQENQGQGGARNRGIELSRGKYIGFVDSDDFIEKDMYRTMHEVLTTSHADIVACQVYSVDENNNTSKTNYNGDINKKIESGKEALKRYLKQGRWGPCDKLYNKELLLNAPFLIKRSCGEDHAVMIPILYNTKRMVTIDNYFYNYRVREGSTTNSSFNIKSFDIIYVWEYVLKQSEFTDIYRFI